MTEVRTPPVAAQHIPEKADFHTHGVGHVPGSFQVTADDDDDGEYLFWYCCPCGIASLRVGNGFKPDESPTWKWNGSLEKPTLEPSVHHRGHWHGWLTDGVWKSC